MGTKIFLTMPQPGETITEGTVVRWLVTPGMVIKEKQILVELETEKAVFEFESPYEGVLEEIVVQDGGTVPVGNPIAIFTVDTAKAQTYFMLGMGKQAQTKSDKPLQKITPKPITFKETTLQLRPISPFIRRLMQEQGVSTKELDSIDGTGRGGRVTKEDMLKYLERREGPGPGPEHRAGASCDDYEIIPCMPIRVRIAENMVRSKQTIPHAHTQLTIDMTRVMEYRKSHRADFQREQGIDLGLLPLIFPTLKLAILAHPLVNASFRQQEGQRELVVYKSIHLGVAVDTPHGLTVPVMHQADQKNFRRFAHDLASLIERAQKNRLSIEDVTGGTFTFNNYGFFGTQIGVQIIPVPQAATLGMGRVERKPAVIDDTIQIRFLADFTLAFDHRVIDGRDAGQFLLALKEGLENFSEVSLI